MLRIRELPEDERPREKMLHFGGGALSNQELLALIIGSGTRAENAMSLAARLLSLSDEGLAALATAGAAELLSVSGIGVATACRVMAASELATRLADRPSKSRMRPLSPEDIAGIFMEELRRYTKEVFIILMLNTKGEIVGRELISVGNKTSSIVDKGEVFKPAIRRGASKIVLVHNHPSGDPSPSSEDILTTKDVAMAGELLGIEVIDHIIIGDGKYLSLKKQGLI